MLSRQTVELIYLQSRLSLSNERFETGLLYLINCDDLNILRSWDTKLCANFENFNSRKFIGIKESWFNIVLNFSYHWSDYSLKHTLYKQQNLCQSCLSRKESTLWLASNGKARLNSKQRAFACITNFRPVLFEINKTPKKVTQTSLNII